MDDHMCFVRTFCGLTSQSHLPKAEQNFYQENIQLYVYLYSFVLVILTQLDNAGRKFWHGAISLIFSALIMRMRLGLFPFFHFK